MTFGFPEAKWLHLTGEVDKSLQVAGVEFFSGFSIPKITKKRLIFDKGIPKKIKKLDVFRTQRSFTETISAATSVKILSITRL